MRVLVIEDEEKLARFLKRGLEAEGYRVDLAADGKSGERAMRMGDYDLIVLDVQLSKKGGLEVIQSLRKDRIRTPMLMLTALSTKEDIVRSPDHGSDDYLTKPFVFNEFLARVRSLIRRSRESTTMLKVGDLQLDTITRKASRNGKRLDLTARECSLLEMLMRNASHVLTRQQLTKEIWGYPFDPGTNVVDVYINHLRKRIDAGISHKLLRTLRGKGYMLTDNPEAVNQV